MSSIKRLLNISDSNQPLKLQCPPAAFCIKGIIPEKVRVMSQLSNLASYSSCSFYLK